MANPRLGMPIIYTDYDSREHAGIIGEVVSSPVTAHYVNVVYFDFRVPGTGGPKGKTCFAVEVQADGKLGDGEFAGSKHTWRPA